jgi:hypothetical protein
MQFKGGKGAASSAGMDCLIDFTKQEMTLLDAAGKRYATLPAAKAGDEMAAAMPAMPDQAKAMMAAMKVHYDSKLTGQTATIQGVDAEERQMEITVEMPAMPNAPAGPMSRVVLHLWMPKAGEAIKNPAIREVAGYNLFAYATMNPAQMLGKMFQQMPGFGDVFTGMTNDMKTASAPVMLRMEMEMYMPMLAMIAKQNPQAAAMFGPGFDPEAALMTAKQELTEVSTAAVPDSVFQIPEGYKTAPASDIMKDIVAKTQSQMGVKKP